MNLLLFEPSVVNKSVILFWTSSAPNPNAPRSLSVDFDS